MATTIEAICGAVFLDGGDDALGAVLETLGLTHPFLEVVTFNLALSPFLLIFKDRMVLSTLIEFLDRT